MASVVGKIKDRIRSRSRSGSTSSDHRPTTARSTDGHDGQTETAHGNYPAGTIPSHYYSNSPRISLENSAFHIHRGSVSGRRSLEQQNHKPIPPPKDDVPPVPAIPPHIGDNSVDIPRSPTGARTDQASSYSSTDNERFPEPGDMASSAGRRSIDGRGVRSNDAEVPEEIVEEMIPQRRSPLASPKRKAVPSIQRIPDDAAQSARLPYRISSRHDPQDMNLHGTSVNGNTMNGYGQPDGHSVTIGRSDQGSSQSRHLTADTAPLNRAATPGLTDSAQLALMYLQKSTDTDQKERALHSGHLNLPEGFNVHDTEETHVYETQRPVVTHETIIKQRTEIVQEEITRDIHVHHYYTYAQPVKVVEILPAKHYHLDLVTGVKTQIPAPRDWQMPLSLRPVAPDTNGIKSWTRHYLVDEAHPTGVLEPPPLKHESGHDNLRHEAVIAV